MSPLEFPAIAKTLLLVCEDNGMYPPDYAAGYIPLRWRAQLPVIESALSKLREDRVAPEDLEAQDRVICEGFHYLDSELWAFVAGEQTVTEQIANRSASLRLANKFLNDFFDGWMHDDQE